MGRNEGGGRKSLRFPAIDVAYQEDMRQTLDIFLGTKIPSDVREHSPPPEERSQFQVTINKSTLLPPNICLPQRRTGTHVWFAANKSD